MLELDESNQILVTNPFSDESPTSSSNNHDILVTLTEDHPLRSRSVLPAPRCNTPSIPSVTVADSEGETRVRLTGPLSLDGSSTADAEENQTTVRDASRGDGDTIIHPVGPHDSFAGVALRHGVSIAALRRANQLWPSDPIHFRTELLIPRGNTVRSRHKTTHSRGTDATLRSAVEPSSNLSPDLLVSSFVSARNIILSVLPARISLDSLSSKASASEDHELDDLLKARARKMPAIESPFAEDGHELSILAVPRAQHKLSGVTLSSHVPTDNQHMNLNHISSVDDLRSRSISSLPNAALKRPPRTQPFTVLPVRTSQLEPEPAMELPVRRSRI
ncbi:hypothetical protein OG21DRAFT_1487464 [Imleria badia]|nr:hypothetical protein OG21DRAFT_1487464 [Imleria badia]